MRSRTVFAFVGTALLVSLLLSACADGRSAETGPRSPAPAGASVRLPDPAAGFDYQLGGAYTPPPGVQVVERDRTAEPARRGYDICYVNGFQTQPDASAAFAAAHPELVVQTTGGPLVDPGWPDEYLFDTSSADRRAALARVVGEWIRSCAARGYSAVEIDNVDSFTRSEGALTAADNLALAGTYARVAHDSGLAIAQKNTADQAKALRALGYDFAVTESCYRFAECDAYTEVYPAVLDVEYADELGKARFAQACKDPERPTAMILRDHGLGAPGSDEYVYESCTSSRS